MAFFIKFDSRQAEVPDPFDSPESDGTASEREVEAEANRVAVGAAQRS